MEKSTKRKNLVGILGKPALGDITHQNIDSETDKPTPRSDEIDCETQTCGEGRERFESNFAKITKTIKNIEARQKRCRELIDIEKERADN